MDQSEKILAEMQDLRRDLRDQTTKMTEKISSTELKMAEKMGELKVEIKEELATFRGELNVVKTKSTLLGAGTGATSGGIVNWISSLFQ